MLRLAYYFARGFSACVTLAFGVLGLWGMVTWAIPWQALGFVLPCIFTGLTTIIHMNKETPHAG